MVSSSITLREFLHADYAVRRLGLSQSSLEQLETAVRRFDDWAKHPVRLAELSTLFVTRFLRDYSKQHAAATVNSKRRAIMSLWRAAHSLGMAPQPDEVPTIKEPRRLPVAWTVEQINQLVAHCRTLPGYVGNLPRCDYWMSLVIVTYWTGCRITALRSTTTVDCDLSARYLIVRADHMKTNSDQMYRLSEQAVAAIRLVHSPNRQLLWPWPHCRRYFWASFRRIVEQSGLVSDTRGMDLFHKIRRTTISYAARDDIHLAMRQAGHASEQTTRRHYIDERIAWGRSAADVLPSLDT